MQQGAEKQEGDRLVRGRQVLQQRLRWRHRLLRRWPRAGTTPRPRPSRRPTWASTLPCPPWVGACLCSAPTCRELRALWEPLLLRQPLLKTQLCREPWSICGGCCPANATALCLASGRMPPKADTSDSCKTQGSCWFQTAHCHSMHLGALLAMQLRWIWTRQAVYIRMHEVNVPYGILFYSVVLLFFCSYTVVSTMHSATQFAILGKHSTTCCCMLVLILMLANPRLFQFLIMEAN